MQVYRGMDIGTAKPSASERAALPQHLIDIRNPDEQFTVGDFCRLADELILSIHAGGALPVVSGGTAFYLKTLMFGMPPSPPSNPQIRSDVRRELEAGGAEALMEELRRGDPLQAAKIHIQDAYRLGRAVEVLRTSGRPLSSYTLPTTPRPDRDFLCLALKRERADIYRRIDERVEAMFSQGLAEEVERLRSAGYGPDAPGMQAIGYREFFEAAPGYETKDLIARIQMDTRRYAKRQLTFFRSLPDVQWFDADDLEGIRACISAWWSD